MVDIGIVDVTFVSFETAVVVMVTESVVIAFVVEGICSPADGYLTPHTKDDDIWNYIIIVLKQSH